MNKPGTHIEQDMLWAARELTMLALCILIAGAIFNGECLAGELPEWVGKIRKDHPRLFFDSETWPEVRKRALGPERQWYHYIKARVDSLVKRVGDKGGLDAKEYGREAAWAAFVYRVTEEQAYIELSKKCLDATQQRWVLIKTRRWRGGSTMSASARGRA